MLGILLQGEAFGIVGILFGILFLLLPLIGIAAIWIIFSKAGEPGWAAIIPIYNLYVLVKITDNEVWWLILFIIPLLNFVAAIKINIDLAKQFGQGLGFGLGLTFLGFIFYPLLAFGSYRYQGNTAAVR